MTQPNTAQDEPTESVSNVDAAGDGANNDTDGMVGDAADDITHYQRLGVSPDATREQIIRAYRRRALKAHPDLFWDKPEKIRRKSQEFGKLSDAYRQLIDPSRRAAYDLSLQTARNGLLSGAAPKTVHKPQRIDGVALLQDYAVLDAVRAEAWENPRTQLVWQTTLHMFVLLGICPIYIVLAQRVDHRWQEGYDFVRLIVATAGLIIAPICPIVGIIRRFARMRAAGIFRRNRKPAETRRRFERTAAASVGLLIAFLDDERFWKGLVYLIAPPLLACLVCWLALGLAVAN